MTDPTLPHFYLPNSDGPGKRGVRDPGDAWVLARDGRRYWGRFGAAGLLARDPDRGILLQHRVAWSDHGNTWGIPGGAINQGEEAIPGAIREANEEAGVPLDAVAPRYTHVVNRGGWTYTTVIADVTVSFEPRVSDPESVALEWVALERVTEHELHPGFAAAWPTLRRLLVARSTADAHDLLRELAAEGHEVAEVGT